MVRNWVFVGLTVLEMLASAGRPAVSAAQEVAGAAVFVKDADAATPRQQQWLNATPEQRVGLSELLGDDGARALAKKLKSCEQSTVSVSRSRRSWSSRSIRRTMPRG